MWKLLAHIPARVVMSAGGLAVASAIMFAGATASLAADSSADKVIVAKQECSPTGQVKVSFAWQSAAQGNQWLDLSGVPDNFVSPAIMSVGPMPSQMTTAVADGLPTRTPYYVRVNTQTASGWSPSSTLSFTTQACDGAPSIASSGSSGAMDNYGNVPGGGDASSGGDAGMGGSGY